MKIRVLVVIAVAVIALATAVLLVTRPGRHGPVGPDALFHAVLDAARRDDEAALLALHVSAGSMRVTTCSPRTGDARTDGPTGRYASDPAEMKAYEVTQLKHQLPHWKDIAVTLGPLHERGEPEVMPATARDSRDRCRGTSSVTLHSYDTTLTTKDGDHTRVSRVTLSAAEIEGAWYFFDLPAPPLTATELRGLRDRMCACATSASPAACAEKVQHAIDAWMRGVEDADLGAMRDEIAACRAKATP